MRLRSLGAVLLGISIFSLAGCGTSGSVSPSADASAKDSTVKDNSAKNEASKGDTDKGNTDKAGKEKINVVASTNVWGSIAKQVGGDMVEVHSIITLPTQDPHDYQATAQDKLLFQQAKLVIVNGGGYDDWATKIATVVNPKPTLIDAVEISGLKKAGEEDFNEHVFYSLNTAKKIANTIADDLAKMDSAVAETVKANATKFNSSIDDLIAKAKQVGTDHANMTAVATEPVTGYLLEDMGISNITPDEFVEQSESDAGPSVKVTQETAGLIADGKAKLLVLNGQTEDSVSNVLKEAATKAHTPIVLVYETFPQGVDSYQDFISQTIEAFNKALS